MNEYIEFNMRQDFDREFLYGINKLLFIFLRRTKSVIIDVNFINKILILSFSKTKKKTNKNRRANYNER